MSNIFKYPDTNSSRAEIDYLNRKLENQKIAIVGLGGTGSYILDLVSKTPVKEIHIFDDDDFQLHNAFRCPGAVEGRKLDAPNPIKKIDHLYSIYSNMHNGITPHEIRITEDNIVFLKDFDYVFISVDTNKSRSIIVEGLLKLGTTFIDVGLGVTRNDDDLLGTIRLTVGSKSKNEHLAYRIGSEEFDENEYGTNIQIAELNSFNASLAVIKWKKMSGFYQDLKEEHNVLYFINTNKLMNEDF